jgi:2-polyprenyl-3-methyl-5-hydroxy-6-metoxy-1,4-benzoquinol methylase
MSNDAHDVLWRRLRYMLSPQWDIYFSFRGKFRYKKVLEVGFGTGAGTIQYAPDALVVHALEIDPGAVDFAKKTYPLENVKWICADITKYSVDFKYDVVVMVETLEHIKEWEKALANIRDHMEPGGMLYMTARNRNADLRRWKDLHEREWTAQELYDALIEYFGQVHLYDYSMTDIQSPQTTLTPLIARAQK